MKTRTFKLNKLVRDKIVAYHLDMGEAKFKTLTGKGLNDAMLNKLIEEVTEIKASGLSIDELADLQEIIDQLIKNHSLSKAEVRAVQAKKRAKNGGFTKGHFIDTVTLPANNKWTKYYANDPQRFPEVENV